MQLSWTSVCNRSVSAPGRNLSNNMLCFCFVFVSIKHTYIPSVHFFFDLSLHPFCDYNHVIIFLIFFKFPQNPTCWLNCHFAGFDTKTNKQKTQHYCSIRQTSKFSPVFSSLRLISPSFTAMTIPLLSVRLHVCICVLSLQIIVAVKHSSGSSLVWKMGTVHLKYPLLLLLKRNNACL